MRRGGVKVVERGLLRRLTEEQSFARTGLVDPSTLRSLGRILSVDAVVTGSFVTIGREVSLNARLIIVETGVIAAAAETRVEREWFDAAGPALLAELSSEYRPPSSESACAGAVERRAGLQAVRFDAKARYWAGRLRRGLSVEDFQAGPAASIADQALRESFMRLTRKYVLEDPERSAAARLPSADEPVHETQQECRL